MDELRHFSHVHPLTLVSTEYPKDGIKFSSCDGCRNRITIPYYICTRDCNFFLHKSCAELPQEFDHPNHPEHTLVLQKPPTRYSGRCICDICRGICIGFIYHCSPCRFDIDINCAMVVQSIQEKIELQSHKHQLNMLQRPASFLCDACGIKHEDASYLCTTCGFWISQKCASSPTVIKIRDYHEPLQLVYSIPADAYYRVQPNCGICNRKVKRTHWAYVSQTSRYFVHISCAASDIEPHVSREKDAVLTFDFGDLNASYGQTSNSSTSNSTCPRTSSNYPKYGKKS